MELSEVATLPGIGGLSAALWLFLWLLRRGDRLTKEGINELRQQRDDARSERDEARFELKECRRKVSQLTDDLFRVRQDLADAHRDHDRRRHERGDESSTSDE